MDCKNRLVQRGSKCSLEVFETDDNKGKGLRTRSVIPIGTFVIEYIGEAVTRNQAAQMLQTLIVGSGGNKGDNPPCYVFITKEHYGKDICKYYYIDATVKGNEARFINHSCEPNLTPVPVRINSTYPHLTLFANRDIQCGEELTFSYGGCVDVTEPGFDGSLYKKCFCGATNCSGYLPFEFSGIS